jgi:hypothetical protein
MKRGAYKLLHYSQNIRLKLKTMQNTENRDIILCKIGEEKV